MTIWIKKTQCTQLGERWDCASIASVSACVCRERGRGPNLWLYLFCHFHCAWYFTTLLLTGDFVCKHQVVVWNSLLSEHFKAVYTDKDGLRWATFSAEYVGQLISYQYISGKLEHIYHEMQQDDSEKDNGPKHMEGVIQRVGILDEIGIEWACQTLPFL